jgi:imidazolonepropionase-like amidohydrolase
VGAIEPGLRADLVLWDENPLADPQGLFAGRTVVKRGVEYSGS